MVSSIGSTGSTGTDYVSQMREKMFTALDSSGDGKLDQSEISQALSGSSQDKSASSLITALDSDGDGSISQLEFDAGMSKLHHEMKNKQSGDGGELFKKIDSNGDGSVSEDEFVSNRPEDVSEEQATQMWGQLDTSGTGSLTESQFQTAMSKHGPPHGPPPAESVDQDDSEQTSTTAASDSSATTDTVQTDSTGETSTESLLKQLLSAAMTKYMQNTSDYLGQALSSSGLTSYA